MTLTIEQTIRRATQALADISPSARLDAEILVMHVCKLSRSGLITHSAQLLLPDEAQELEKLLARRQQGEPIAYIIGRREFWSLDLQVTPDVLIPRPETELLVEQALRYIPIHVRRVIADLGTGSGAIALAIAKERPDCQVIATDDCEKALAIAQANAVRLKIDNVEFRYGKWMEPIAADRLDMIVSNPPYIPAQDPHLREGDVRFEPRAALIAGIDGLDAIRSLAADAHLHLKPGGQLLLEHGYDQARQVAEILHYHEYRAIHCHTDLAGLERLTVCSSA